MEKISLKPLIQIYLISDQKPLLLQLCLHRVVPLKLLIVLNAGPLHYQCRNIKRSTSTHGNADALSGYHYLIYPKILQYLKKQFQKNLFNSSSSWTNLPPWRRPTWPRAFFLPNFTKSRTWFKARSTEHRFGYKDGVSIMKKSLLDVTWNICMQHVNTPIWWYTYNRDK